MSDLVDLFQRAAGLLGVKVHAIRDDQWSLPTPCTEWNVRALVRHLVYECLWVPPLFAGATIGEVGNRFDGEILGDDPGAAWDAAVAPAVAAVGAPEALDRTVHLSFGDTSGRDYAEQLFTDLAIHGWDLARAIGYPETIDPEFVEVIYEQVKPSEDQLKATGLFGPKVEPPAGADRQTQLLAVFGRVA